MSSLTAQVTEIQILPAGIRLAIDPGETIIGAIRRHGYRTRYSCRRGGCGACKADLVQGRVSYQVAIADSVLSHEERANGKCLPCRAVPNGDVVIHLAPRDRLHDVLGTRVRNCASTPSIEPD
ncbi:2Fe-2S iron-sulfur cluster-binding protein [Gordonia phthalatica]|uniref:2Fe-2S ferredoxin-type domain-containing protein n=1 Tax=Gordonia phthalatica TaxID=1136941 RepID=A0A0N9N6A3_9ACTN|nr:2Fe-2S iron-sulfur cluster-binding protein [Gordonia phthalatica]ALG86085.1 hypothetical protein ACH46_18255 [Gordonia phthalatica]